MKRSVTTASIPGMRGDYSRYALTQKNAVSQGLDKATQQLFMQLPAVGNDLHIVDLGTADGVNGFQVITRIAESVSNDALNTDSALKVTHVDVPKSDFDTLKENVYHHADSYYLKLPEKGFRVQPDFVAGSFYAPYVSPGTADIIFSTIAFHYASKSICPVADHIDPVYACGKTRQQWQALSDDDLELILTHVHEGLKPGGKFWAVIPTYTRDSESGDIVNHWQFEVWKIMIDRLKSMVASGQLARSTWKNFVLPIHIRHIDEWTHWFNNNQDRFRLEFADVISGSNPYLNEYLKHQNPERFADDYVGFTRAWAERIISNLIPDQRLVDQFFDGLREEYGKNPHRFANDNISVYIGATRL